MATRDIYNNLNDLVAFNTQSITTNTTTAGVIIDTQGCNSLLFVIQSGTLTDGTYTPLIEYGDDSGLSDAAAVPDDQLNGTEAGAAFADTDDNATKSIGYVGDKRYVRLSIVSASTTSVGGGTLSAVALRGTPTIAPVA